MNNNSISCPLIFVVTDGIEHSVFAGQVIAPLIKKLEKNREQVIYIVSFEKNPVAADVIKRYEQLHPRLKMIIFTRWPFFGAFSLYRSIIPLKRFLKQFTQYRLIARGPLAGWIVLRAYNKKKCDQITIQARGLLAEEYSFAYVHNKNVKGVHKWFHCFRHRALYTLEKSVYTNSPAHIEAVTPALKEFLMTTFGANEQIISVASQDIPKPIARDRVQQWRTQTRKKLKISPTTYVYCYNGSLKSWQCPDHIISFFKSRILVNPNSFLLVLTPDKLIFENALLKYHISHQSVSVLSIDHADVYHYLAAADVGIMFREPHLVSWVSRPVKAMEYEAVGLPIIHNGTVAWLNERYPHIMRDQI